MRISIGIIRCSANSVIQVINRYRLRMGEAAKKDPHELERQQPGSSLLFCSERARLLSY